MPFSTRTSPFIAPPPELGAERAEEFKARVLERLRDHIVATISNYITTANMFKHSDGSRLAESVDAYIDGEAIVIHSSEAHFKYQNEGVRPHTMWYLLGKTIPLKDASGNTVFRKVTMGSFLKGKWQHKGTEGKHFIEKGVAQAMVDLGSIMQEVTFELQTEDSMIYGIERAA